MLTPVILSGGSGTRLWPLSRELYPKQLLPLVGERTMLQETVLRLGRPRGRRADRLSCATRRIASSWPNSCGSWARRRRPSSSNPVGRNTAPAIALAALQASAEALLLVLPADHVIRDVASLPGRRAASPCRRRRRASW